MNAEFKIPNGILKIRDWGSNPEIYINNKSMDELLIGITDEIKRLQCDDLIVDLYISMNIKNPNAIETIINDSEV